MSEAQGDVFGVGELVNFISASTRVFVVTASPAPPMFPAESSGDDSSFVQLRQVANARGEIQIENDPQAWPRVDTRFVKKVSRSEAETLTQGLSGLGLSIDQILSIEH